MTHSPASNRGVREYMVNVGPCVVPTYPFKAFSRFPRDIDMYSVWRLVGPTVQRNMNAPLWQQFCAVYLEGLNHGSGAMEELRNG